MKVAAIATIKNEEDVLPSWLDYMSNHVDYFLFRDNESDDNTPDILQSHPKTVFYEKIKGRFQCSMYGRLIHECQRYLSENDWFIIGAPDLFPLFNVKDLISRASLECNCISTYFINFFFTQEMYDRYCIDEEYKNIIDKFNISNYSHFYNTDKNPTLIIKNIEGVYYQFPKQEPPFIPNKHIFASDACFGHYRFRSPNQMEKRMKIRQQVNPSSDSNLSFGFYSSWDWKDYLFPKDMLHKYKGEFKRDQLDRKPLSELVDMSRRFKI